VSGERAAGCAASVNPFDPRSAVPEELDAEALGLAPDQPRFLFRRRVRRIALHRPRLVAGIAGASDGSGDRMDAERLRLPLLLGLLGSDRCRKAKRE
jgi:hypothetical protein